MRAETQQPEPERAPVGGAGPFRARAALLGARLELRGLDPRRVLARAPVVISAGASGCAVLFRFGCVVSFGLPPPEEAALLRQLATRVVDPFAQPETEETEVHVDASPREVVDAGGDVWLRAPSLENLQALADVLAKSTLLAHYEQQVGDAFDRVEELLERLRGERRGRRTRGRDLLREIGDVLLIQSRMVGRAEVTEKPEHTWEHSEADRLHESLADEYELLARDRALERKLELIYRSASTSLDLTQTRQALRVEWYIVILILVEIVLIVYDLFGAH